MRYDAPMRAARGPGTGLTLAGAAAILAGLYLAGPGLALMRLRRAMRDGDTLALRQLVDFPAVRAGLARQVAETALGAPHRKQALVPFGFSFVRHIAAHEIATRLTPAGLIRLARGGDAGTAMGWHLAGYRLIGPTQVRLRLRAAGDRTLRLTMALEGGRWRLTGMRLPAAMLDGGARDAP